MLTAGQACCDAAAAAAARSAAAWGSQTCSSPHDRRQSNATHVWRDAQGAQQPVLAQPEMDEDFEALYGAAPEPEAAPQAASDKQDAQKPGTAPVAAAAEPDDLFAQLYGSGAPDEDATGAPKPSSSRDGRPAFAALAADPSPLEPCFRLLCPFLRRIGSPCAAAACSSIAARCPAGGSGGKRRRAARRGGSGPCCSASSSSGSRGG